MANLLNSDTKAPSHTNDIWSPRPKQTDASKGPKATDTKPSGASTFFNHLQESQAKTASPMPKKPNAPDRKFSAEERGGKSPTTSPSKNDIKDGQTPRSERTAPRAPQAQTSGQKTRSQDLRTPSAKQSSDTKVQSSTKNMPNSTTPGRPALSPQQQAAAVGTRAPLLPVNVDQAPQLAMDLPLSQPPQGLVIDTSQEAVTLKDLRNLSFSLGGRDALIQQSPLLALLSGHLESLLPADLPQLVADNPFIQDVLSQPQIELSFQMPGSLDQILGKLGLENSGLSQFLSMAGIGQEQSSVQNVLQALGFDVEKMQTEAGQFKDSLPIDGLRSYMLRAAKMKAQKQATELAGLAQVPGMPVLNPQNLAQSLQADANKKQPAIQLANHLGPNLTAQKPFVPALWEINPTQGTITPIDPSLDPELANQLTSGLAAQDFAILGEEQNPPVAYDAAPKSEHHMAMPNPAPLPPQEALPFVQTTSRDPFMALAQQWDKSDIQSFQWKEADTNHLNPEPQQNPDRRITPDFRSIPVEVLQPMADSALPMEFEVGLKEVTPDTTSNGSLTQLVSSEANLSQDNQGNFRQGEEERSAPDKDSSWTPALPNSAQTKSAPSTQFQVTPNVPQNNSAANAEAMRNIFDKASMLIKEGGGSIRVDLGTDSLGTIDLALNITDKNVDLRIVASSQQARDILTQDLHRLRESLMQQNMNLDKVEIGLSGGSAWSQSSRDGRSSQGQNFEWVEQGSARGPGGVKEVRSYRQASSNKQTSVTPNHNGQIQVRI